jgi:hypothetical protein
MLCDLNRVDFGNVQEQASWVCQCDANMVQKLEGEFKSTLQEQVERLKPQQFHHGLTTKTMKLFRNYFNSKHRNICTKRLDNVTLDILF